MERMQMLNSAVRLLSSSLGSTSCSYYGLFQGHVKETCIFKTGNRRRYITVCVPYCVYLIIRVFNLYNTSPLV